MGDMGHGQVGGLQKDTAFTQTQTKQIIDRGDAIGLGKVVRHVIFADMHQIGKHIQRNGLLEMTVKVSADGGGILIAVIGGRNHVGRVVGASHQANDENIKQVLADGFVAGGFISDFLEHILQVSLDLPAALMKMGDIIGAVFQLA